MTLWSNTTGIWEHEGNVFSSVLKWSVLCSDKTWVFDQSERTPGPIYMTITVKMTNNIHENEIKLSLMVFKT